MTPRQSKRGKRISLQQEKRTARELGGQTMAASGATRLGGGADVRIQGKTRVECKFTEKDKYTLWYRDLRKLQKQAIKNLEIPVLQFAFKHRNGKLSRYAVMPWTDEEYDGSNDWFGSHASVSFTEDQLESALKQGKLRYTFYCEVPQAFLNRVFEIIRWDDYISREEHNVGDKHDSSIPRSTDTSSG